MRVAVSKVPLEKLKPLLSVTAAVVVVVVVYFLTGLGNSYNQQVIALCCIFIVLVSSLNIVVGLAGLVSIGHQAFFGLGAYVSALLTLQTDVPSYVGVLAAMAAAGPIAWAVGKITLRLRAAFFVIATLAVAEIFRTVVINAIDFTGGPNGLPGVPPLEIPGGMTFLTAYEALIPLSVIAALCVLACQWMSNSEFGSKLRAMRENEELAKALGINTPNLASIAFVVSASMASMAGALYAHFVGFIAPDLFSFSLMVTLLLMLVAGGIGTVMGPVVGAVAFTLLPEVLRFSDQWRLVIYGVALMLLARLLPEGLWGGVTRLRDFAFASRARTSQRTSGPKATAGLVPEGAER
ncbi:MAG: branched-chain amino acid ABC transporter permease [Mycolicibacterium sp.]|uniref:branched-chain amino acid ABC transporter permease n=1 Tax=Mycolicibacterium sp. TaxID=2320850 RepID=UPI003D148329